MEHPCFTVSRVLDGKVVGGWKTHLREDGSKEYLYYWIADYLRRHSYTVEWKHDRLPSSFVTTGFHRPLSDYVNALNKHGLAVTGLDEPQPLEEGVRVQGPPVHGHRSNQDHKVTCAGMSKVKLVMLFYQGLLQCGFKCWRRNSQCVLGGNHGLGKVRTEHIKRLARELVRRFPNKFSKDFESNKQAVSMLIQGATTKVRNQVAGYITHVFAVMPTASSDENTEEDE